MRLNTLEVTVQTSDLLESLRFNRAAHAEETRLAREGFKIELERELAEKLERVRNGESIQLSFRVRPPDVHLDDYDDVIGMLDMALETSISISHDQFKCWVNNQWEWRDMWAVANTGYVSSARAAGR